MEPLAHKKCFCNSVLHGSKTHSAPEGLLCELWCSNPLWRTCRVSIPPQLPGIESPPLSPPPLLSLSPSHRLCVLYVLHVCICVIMCISTGMHFHGKHVDTRGYGCQSSPVWVRVLVQHCICQPPCSVSFLGFFWFVPYCLSQQEPCQCRRGCPALSQSLGSHASRHSALPTETSLQPRKCIWSIRSPSEAKTIRVW